MTDVQQLILPEQTFSRLSANSTHSHVYTVSQKAAHFGLL